MKPIDLFLVASRFALRGDSALLVQATHPNAVRQRNPDNCPYASRSRVIASATLSHVDPFTGGLAATLFVLTRGILRAVGVRIDPDRPKQATMDEVRERLSTLTAELEQINEDAEIALSAELTAAAASRREAENAAALAGMSSPEREATEALVSGAIDRALTRTSRQERKFQIGLAAVSFTLGAIVSVGGTLLVQAFSS